MFSRLTKGGAVHAEGTPAPGTRACTCTAHWTTACSPARGQAAVGGAHGESSRGRHGQGREGPARDKLPVTTSSRTCPGRCSVSCLASLEHGVWRPWCVLLPGDGWLECQQPGPLSGLPSMGVAGQCPGALPAGLTYIPWASPWLSDRALGRGEVDVHLRASTPGLESMRRTEKRQAKWLITKLNGTLRYGGSKGQA